MANHPYTLISIIYLSYYQLIPTFAAIVDIEGSSYKLSTDIEYALYEAHEAMNDYLYNAADGNLCSYSLFNHHITMPSKPAELDKKAKWKIEKTKYGYAIKNVATGGYLSRICSDGNDGEIPFCWEFDGGCPPSISVQTILSAYDQPGVSWTFYAHGDPFTHNSQSIPRVGIKAAETEHDGLITMRWINYQCGKDWPQSIMPNGIWQYPPSGCSDPSHWVFIPTSLPPNCEKITAISANATAFQSMTTQISSSLSAENRNAGSTEVTFTTPEQEKCETVTTSFTRTEGSENTYGWSIAFQWPQISAGPVSLGGGPSAEYHDDWTRYSETEETKTEEQDTCITFPSTDVICPPRTICNREVTTFRPEVSEVDYTIIATCDGRNYTTKGKASLKGIVRMRYEDRLVPMDCRYYTTDYNIFEPGTLQFCDTCNNNKTCEICRDGYILLDGVCITASTCEVTCGGSVRGGKYLEILGGLGPWSGGFCHINNRKKYRSDSCREQLGGADPKQTGPGPIDDPSIGEDTDTILDDLCVLNHAQCGGIGYDGPSKCCQYPDDPREWRCIFMSEWHSQCNPLPN